MKHTRERENREGKNELDESKDYLYKLILKVQTIRASYLPSSSSLSSQLRLNEALFAFFLHK